jgi:microcin C transport system substrate-binding protein
MPSFRTFLSILFFVSLTSGLWPLAGDAHAATHALTLFGEPKHKPGFTHFPYTNPKAPKGGTLKLANLATFDSLNPFILKGLAAPGMNGLVFQSLMLASLDEAQTYYPLIARSFKKDAENRWIEFTLDPRARWQDGAKITVDDVIFSLEMLKTKAHPAYRVLYRPFATAEQTGSHTVRFTFSEGDAHRELPLYAAALPVLPKHYYAKIPFDKSSLEPPVGSGPYRVEKLDAGRSITFVRVKNYWAENLPTQRGMYRFERIKFDVYRDDVVSVEGIKSGQFDYYEEYIARNFATSYNIPAVAQGRLIKTAIPNKIPRGMQAFLFNTRRPKFADMRVREAIGLTMDYEWMNQRLFYNAYTRTESFFQNTDFASKGLPGEDEVKLLEPFRDQLPPPLFTESFYVPKTDGTGQSRANLIRAQMLLDEAGWVMRNGRRIHVETGEPFEIEFMMRQRTFERVIAIMRYNLKKLGIAATFRYVDDAQYQKRIDRRDFDIVSIWWNLGTFFPGTEQFAYWHSSQADVEGAQNLGGVQNPVVDMLVERVANAKTLEELTPAARALDRVLLWNQYVIPHWYLGKWRILYWNKFGKPKIQPDYAVGVIETWWMK